jgi:hypothetical protein
MFVPRISDSVKVETPQKAIVYPQNSETMFQVPPTEDLLVFLNGILLACAKCLFFLHVLDVGGQEQSKVLVYHPIQQRYHPMRS